MNNASHNKKTFFHFVCNLGLVVHQKVDLALSTFGVREDRAKVVDYLIVDENLMHGYFYIKNPRNTYDWIVFFQPLRWWAWIGLMTFSFLIPVMIALIVFFREYQE